MTWRSNWSFVIFIIKGGVIFDTPWLPIESCLPSSSCRGHFEQTFHIFHIVTENFGIVFNFLAYSVDQVLREYCSVHKLWSIPSSLWQIRSLMWKLVTLSSYHPRPRTKKVSSARLQTPSGCDRTIEVHARIPLMLWSLWCRNEISNR